MEEALAEAAAGYDLTEAKAAGLGALNRDVSTPRPPSRARASEALHRRALRGAGPSAPWPGTPSIGTLSPDEADIRGGCFEPW